MSGAKWEWAVVAATGDGLTKYATKKGALAHIEEKGGVLALSWCGVGPVWTVVLHDAMITATEEATP